MVDEEMRYQVSGKKALIVAMAAMLPLSMSACAQGQEESQENVETCVDWVPLGTHDENMETAELVVVADVVRQVEDRQMLGVDAHQWELGVEEVLKGEGLLSEGEQLVIGSTPQTCQEGVYLYGDPVGNIADIDEASVFYLTNTDFSIDGEEEGWALMVPGAISDVEDVENEEEGTE